MRVPMLYSSVTFVKSKCRAEVLNDHLFWKKLFIRFSMHVFREHLSTYVYVSFPLCYI